MDRNDYKLDAPFRPMVAKLYEGIAIESRLAVYHAGEHLASGTSTPLTGSALRSA